MKNKKRIIIGGVTAIVVAGAIVLVALLNQPKPVASPETKTETTVKQDPNAPTIDLSTGEALSDQAYVNESRWDDFVSCYDSVYNVTKNIDAKIRSYIMPETCTDGPNLGFSEQNITFRFTEVAAGQGVTIHDVIKTTIADGKTAATIFKIDRSVKGLYGETQSWVQPAAVIKTIAKDTAGKDHPVYIYLTDDSQSDMIDYKVLQDQVKRLVIKN